MTETHLHGHARSMTYLGSRPETRHGHAFLARTSLACGVLGVLTTTAFYLLPAAKHPITVYVTIGFALGGTLTGIPALRQPPRGDHRRSEHALAGAGLVISVLTLVGWALCGLLISLLIIGFSHAQFSS